MVAPVGATQAFPPNPTQPPPLRDKEPRPPIFGDTSLGISKHKESSPGVQSGASNKLSLCMISKRYLFGDCPNFEALFDVVQTS